MRLLSGILGALLAAVVIVFALSNRQAVLVGFWPLSDGVVLPLYLAVLLTFALGVVSGWLVVGWLGWRRRRARKKAEA